MALPRVNQQQFSQLLAGPRPLVVKFSAAWCGPCKAFAPIVETAAANHPELQFVEVDLDESPGLAAQWQVRGIPSMLGFRDGRVAFQFSGLVPAGVLEQHLKALG